MTAPNFWSEAEQDPGDYSEAIAADVAGILTTLKDKLVTNGTWSLVSESAGTNLLVKTPVLPSGVFMDVLFTKIDADTLEIRVRDQLGNNIMGSRRIDIESAGNTTVEYYWGNTYVHVLSRRATAEPFMAEILDPSGFCQPENITANKVVAWAYRSSAGSTTAATVGTMFAWDNGVSTSAVRAKNETSDTNGNDRNMYAVGGGLYCPPVGIHINQSGTIRWTGVLPGMAYIEDSEGAFDALKNLPVDTGVKKAFIVLPYATASGHRWMVMKPSQNP